MVVCVLVPQLIFMRRSKVSLIFNGVSGETFHDSPDAGKYNWNTARHTNVLVPFMSRSKVSLIFDGVSGETFMIRLMPENTTGILLDTRIYCDCCSLPFHSPQSQCEAGVDELRF